MGRSFRVRDKIANERSKWTYEEKGSEIEGSSRQSKSMRCKSMIADTLDTKRIASTAPSKGKEGKEEAS